MRLRRDDGRHRVLVIGHERLTAERIERAAAASALSFDTELALPRIGCGGAR